MRRVASVAFLAIGGWLLIAEPLIAFMDLGPGMRSGMPLVLAICLVMAAVPLSIGVALSRGERRRELGLTILIAEAAAVFTAGSLAAIFLDPGFKQFMPLMPLIPKIGVAWALGTANLLAFTAIGWWLYRLPRGRKA